MKHPREDSPPARGSESHGCMGTGAWSYPTASVMGKTWEMQTRFGKGLFVHLASQGRQASLAKSARQMLGQQLGTVCVQSTAGEQNALERRGKGKRGADGMGWLPSFPCQC